MVDDPGRILRRRAEELARPLEDQDDVRTHEIVLVSVAGGRRYGAETHLVARITPAEQLCRLPAGCAPFFAVAPIGGHVVPVVDLATMLDLDSTPTGRGFVVALERGTDVLGLLVDAVHDVIEVPQSVLSPVPQVDRQSTALAQATTPDGVVLLDIHSFFTDERLVVSLQGQQPLSDTIPPHGSQE